MQVKELMSKPAVTCAVFASLNAVARLMWEQDCGAIPVVGEDGALVGIVTDRDICMAAYTQGKPLHAIPVSNAMAKRVFSCHADDTIDAAERLMSEKQVRRLPIVDPDGRPVGLLSLNDIAREVCGKRKKSGVEHEVVQTLAAIGQRRPRERQRRQAVAPPPVPG